MPPRGVNSAKRKRQYEHIKESQRGNPRAEEIAARTVNKQRSQAGETKRGGGRKRKTSKKSTRGRKSSSSTGRSSASSRKGTRKGTKRSSKKR